MSEIPSRFTREEILERYLFFCDECQLFINHFQIVHPTVRLSYDPLVMLGVVQSAMDDIWRYKAYHLDGPDKLSDCIKRAAYFTKWLVKFRPIYHNRILSENVSEVALDKKDSTLLVNEGFVVHRALNAIATEMRVETIKLDSSFHADLLYDLHYRNLSADALLSLFGIIRDTAGGNSCVMQVTEESSTK